MQPYRGPFSFVTSQLHSDVKTILPDYDEHDPKTWPYVTMEAVEKHGKYSGYTDLLEGIAYERSVMKRYESMYSAADRKHIASVNGSFHKRCPCKYDEHDKPKSQVGMSHAEYRNYMATAAKDTSANTPASKLRRPQQKRKYDTKRNKSHDARRCANKKCLETRREAARLWGELFDRENQVFSSQHVREFEATGRRRSGTTS